MGALAFVALLISHEAIIYDVLMYVNTFYIILSYGFYPIFISIICARCYMALLEKQLNKYIEANFAEKEKALAETERSVQRHFAKSREYRIMLQNYQKELRERDSALSEKDAELSKRKEDLDEFESTLKARVKEDVMREAKEEKAALKADSIRLQEEIKSLSAKKAGLMAAEYKIIDWVSRMEQKEGEVFDEILADANKFQKFKLSIDGYEFESYVADLLAKNGYEKVEVTKKSQDFGADILAEKNDVRYAFQCKYYSGQVGIEAVQQIYAAKEHYDSHVAVVVTNSVYTKAAKILAEELNVVLWDCEDLSVLSQSKG